jgi:hypothetical protein
MEFTHTEKNCAFSRIKAGSLQMCDIRVEAPRSCSFRKKEHINFFLHERIKYFLLLIRSESSLGAAFARRRIRQDFL